MFLKRPSKAVCPLCSRTYSLKWVITQRKSTGNTSFNAIGHVRQITCRSPRYSDMPRPSKRESVWWPGIGRQLEELVNECPVCRKYRRNHVEPVIASELPDYPWQKVASDQLFWKGKIYILVVDYYSHYVEVSPLASTTSQSIIASLKTIFSRFGIPETFISDNGPNYVSKDFVNFAKDYGFTHVTSSPLYAQANGEAERAVRTVKRLFDKCPVPHLALLAYRSTPLEQGYSPALLLMSRNLRTTVPIHTCKLKPEVIAPERLSKKDSELKQRQKENYDSRHRVHDLPPLTAGDQVYLFGESTVKGVPLCQRLMVRCGGTKDILTRCPKTWQQKSHNPHHSLG